MGLTISDSFTTTSFLTSLSHEPKYRLDTTLVNTLQRDTAIWNYVTMVFMNGHKKFPRKDVSRAEKNNAHKSSLANLLQHKQMRKSDL